MIDIIQILLLTWILFKLHFISCLETHSNHSQEENYPHLQGRFISQNRDEFAYFQLKL